ncbi:MAG TPA: Fur family transcriptional regulator [Pseudomonadota bacterium]|mgnify:FL=1|jgi:Fe2+ or Zn2+ uptake regulation protein|nr:Fur family transcriptional regulator [Pseudomonadota bacterium]HNK43989.1 Fur family transcriptional regulator [Pseudomonadota bacterium]HNN50350.1 Fur family transcriptional regulator [Pseudomonadota bacterium]
MSSEKQSPAPAHSHSKPTGEHASHNHKEQARSLLGKGGLRITAPRLSVLTALIDSHRPMSAQEVIDKLAPAGIDHVTVYRTLNTLVDAGIAQAVGTTERGRRFEVHACEGCRVGHPHLECRRCGHLVCLEQGLLPTMVVPTELAGFQVEEARLYLYGTCGSCQAVAKAK